MTGTNWLSWYVEFSHVAATVAANLLVQSTLIVGTGLAAALALRKRGVAVQSSVLRATLLAVLLCPLASWLLGAGGISGLRITLPTTLSASREHQDLGPSPALRPTEGMSDSPAGTGHLESRSSSAPETRGRNREAQPTGDGGGLGRVAPGSSAQASSPTSGDRASGLASSAGRLDVLAIAYGGLAAAWLAVAGLLAVRLGVAHLLMCSACRDARPAGEALRAECRALADAMGLRAPRLLISGRITNPCLVGWRRPAILLPSGGETISRQVLVHELAHLARRDCLWNLAGRLSASLLFFQALLWVLRRRLAQAADEVCDDYVVVHSGDRASYARQLVDMAERLQLQWPAQTAGVGVIAFKSSLGRRVGRILDTSRGLSLRTGGGALSAIACLGLCGTLLVGLIGAEGTGALAGKTEERALARADAEGAGTDEKPTSPPTADEEQVVFQGRVLGPDGQPFAGAKLYVQTEYDSNVRTELPVRATTAADGAFRFEVAQSEFDPAGAEMFARYRPIIATAKGYGPGWGNGAEEGELALRLVKDDATIEGRIVDEQGEPVGGVTVRVIQIKTTEDENLTPWTEALRTAREAHPLENEFFRKVAPMSLLGHALPPRTTGPDGRFVLTGIGKERMVALRVEGPTIATRIINVMTRPAERVELPGYETAPSLGINVYYGAKFEHQVASVKPIVGVVRDKDTGKPLAGVTLRGEPSLGGSGLMQWVEATTDAQGKYRLLGMPRRKRMEVLAIPPDDQPYLLSQLKVGESPDSDEITLDFELKRGIWIEGKVTDKVTGETVERAAVFYAAFVDNPHATRDRGLYYAARGWIDSYYVTTTGSFRRVGLPKHGLIAVRATGDKEYRMGIGADQVKEGWYGEDKQFLNTVSGFCTPTNFSALVEIHPAEGQDPYECSVELDPGLSVTGEVQDPDGKPLAGAMVNGAEMDFRTWGHSPLPTATFTVNTFDPSKPRRVLFLHKERRLAGSVAVQGEDPGPLTVRLVPWGVITGRLVDADGKPRAGIELIGYGGLEAESASEAPTTGILLREPKTYTDGEGRFCIEGLIPGLKYNIAVREMMPERDVPRLTGRVVHDLILKPGQAKELGDVQPKRLLPPR